MRPQADGLAGAGPRTISPGAEDGCHRPSQGVSRALLGEARLPAEGRLRPTGQGDSRLAEGKGDLAEAANYSESRGPALPVVRPWSP